jgi:phage terminase Nu1 subunit (DNA packaging protein)
MKRAISCCTTRRGKLVAVAICGVLLALVGLGIATLRTPMTEEQRFADLVMAPVPATVNVLQFGQKGGFIDAGFWAFHFAAPAEEITRIISRHGLVHTESHPDVSTWKAVLKRRAGLQLDTSVTYAVYVARREGGVLRLLWHKPSGTAIIMYSSV